MVDFKALNIHGCHRQCGYPQKAHRMCIILVRVPSFVCWGDTWVLRYNVGMGGLLFPAAKQGFRNILLILIINSIHNTNFIKKTQHWMESRSSLWGRSNPSPCPGLQMYLEEWKIPLALYRQPIQDNWFSRTGVHERVNSQLRHSKTPVHNMHMACVTILNSRTNTMHHHPAARHKGVWKPYIYMH